MKQAAFRGNRARVALVVALATMTVAAITATAARPVQAGGYYYINFSLSGTRASVSVSFLGSDPPSLIWMEFHSSSQPGATWVVTNIAVKDGVSSTVYAYAATCNDKDNRYFKAALDDNIWITFGFDGNTFESAPKVLSTDPIQCTSGSGGGGTGSGSVEVATMIALLAGITVPLMLYLRRKRGQEATAIADGIEA